MYIEINKKLVKEKRIKMEPMNISFEVFNADRTKNGEVIKYTLLEVEINRYTERIDVAVTDLNGTDIFLGYDWLVKHNPKVNWKTGTRQFTRYSRTYRIHHQDILFTLKTRRLQPTDNQNKEQ